MCVLQCENKELGELGMHTCTCTRSVVKYDQSHMMFVTRNRKQRRRRKDGCLSSRGRDHKGHTLSAAHRESMVAVGGRGHEYVYGLGPSSRPVAVLLSGGGHSSIPCRHTRVSCSFVPAGGATVICRPHAGRGWVHGHATCTRPGAAISVWASILVRGVRKPLFALL